MKLFSPSGSPLASPRTSFSMGSPLKAAGMSRRTSRVLVFAAISSAALLFLGSSPLRASVVRHSAAPEGRPHDRSIYDGLPLPPIRSWPFGAGAQGDEEGEWFPDWFGNVDEIGPSPYDYVPRRRERKARVLFLTEYNDLERMNTALYEIVDAALRHAYVEVDVWGLGWKGWDASQPVSYNLARRVLPSAGPGAEPVGTGYWDVVWTFARFGEDEMMDLPGGKTLHLHQIGDCHGDMSTCRVNGWYPRTSNITITKYAHELFDAFGSYDWLQSNYPSFEMQLFGHSPDAANEWDFYPPRRWADKTRDATVLGFDGSFYPIRTTVTDAIREGTTFIERHQHPGYTISHSDDIYRHPPATYDPASPTYEKHVATRKDFAKSMRDSRVCVFDSALERKAIRKYAQALLSGCVIAGDLPTQHEREFRDFVIQLEPEWEIDRINAAIRAALADPLELKRKALAGFAFARQYYTNLAKVDGVLDLVSEYRAGARGYVWPAGFSAKCRTYWSEGGYRPPWCGTEGMRGLEGR